MKYLIVVLSAITLLFVGCLRADSGLIQYRVTQGQQWSGVKIGGEAPRMRDSICKNRRCYLIGDIYRPVSSIMRKYGLRDLRFSELVKVGQPTDNSDQVILPADLGQEMFFRARTEKRRENNDSNLWIRFRH